MISIIKILRGGYSYNSLKELKIKLIIWDLDDTLWKGTLAEGETPILYKERAEIVKNLNLRGIVNSICSKNDFTKAKDMLLHMKIWDQFVFPKISYMPKGEMVKNILDEMHLQAKHTLFIDDNEMNLNEVKYYNPEIHVLNAKYSDEIPVNEWGTYDENLTRLKQYKTLEEKTEVRKKSSSNEKFLKQSNIKIEFINFSDDLFDRLYELITRTNQLNFTKIRSNKYELHALINNHEIKTQLIRAEDNFGNYGIIGFYSLFKDKLVHFVFSCRIMNMGIEQFVYEYLNYPKLDVVGEVASKVGKYEKKIDFIQILDSEEVINDDSIKHILNENSKVNIFAIGACDLFHVLSYFDRPNQYLFYECNVFFNGVRGVNVGTEYIRSQIDMSEEEKAFCKAHFTNYARHNVFHSKIFDGIWDYVILSFLDDMVLRIYEYKTNPNLRVIFSPRLRFTKTNIVNIHGQKMTSWENQLEWLAENFNEGHFISQERFLDNLLFITNKIPKETKIILINGPELDYFREDVPHCEEVREQIIAINQTLKTFAEKIPERVVLIDINEFVKSTDDVTNYVFHLKANTAYNLFLKIMETMLIKFPTKKPPLLQKVLNGRKLCLFGKNDLELKNACYNLHMGNCNPEKFIYHNSVANSTFKIDDWKDFSNKSEEYFIVVVDNENYGEIRQLLIDGNYEPLKDFVQLK